MENKPNYEQGFERKVSPETERKGTPEGSGEMSPEMKGALLTPEQLARMSELREIDSALPQTAHETGAAPETVKNLVLKRWLLRFVVALSLGSGMGAMPQKAEAGEFQETEAVQTLEAEAGQEYERSFSAEMELAFSYLPAGVALERFLHKDEYKNFRAADMETALKIVDSWMDQLEDMKDRAAATYARSEAVLAHKQRMLKRTPGYYEHATASAAYWSLNKERPVVTEAAINSSEPSIQIRKDEIEQLENEQTAKTDQLEIEYGIPTNPYPLEIRQYVEDSFVNSRAFLELGLLQRAFSRLHFDLDKMYTAAGQNIGDEGERINMQKRIQKRIDRIEGVKGYAPSAGRYPISMWEQEQG